MVIAVAAGAAKAAGVGEKPHDAVGDTHRAGTAQVHDLPPAAPAADRAVAVSRGGRTPARTESAADARPRRGPALQRVLLQMPPASWAYIDLTLVAVATYITYRVLVFGSPAYKWVVNPWLSGAAFCACIIVSGMIFGLYERETLQARSRILARSTLTAALGLTLAFACLSLFFYAEVSRWLGLFAVLIYLGAAMSLRVFAHNVITEGRVHVLCVGCGDSIRKTVSLLGNAGHPHFRIVGHVCVAGPTGQPGCAASRDSRFIPDGDNGDTAQFEQPCPCLGSTDELAHVLQRHTVDEVVVDAELVSEPAVERAILAALKARCRVIDQPTFIEKLLGEVPAEHITTQWFLLADVQHTAGYEAVKRIMDVAAAMVGLALTLPLWPLIALAVWLDSRGRVVFKQERVGVHGRRFKMYKFRTMRVDAEAGGARWAERRDARVTLVGRFLRKSRLDELPQLWNILRGDMALVGPRPERPEFVEMLARRIPHYEQRHLIKPGLTGWAQIHYRYGASVRDAQRKLCYDLYYLKRRSVDLDLAIIVRTIGTFLLGAR